MWESESVLPVSQPDMTLSDQELFGDDHPHDHCGVFGVWAPGEDVSRLTYFSLYALQHRGQQSAGIATSNGKQILVYKDQGLVSQVFSEQSLQGLRGHIALGHVRYATTGADVWRNAQPTLGPTPTGTLALAHNGNLTNTVELRELAVRDRRRRRGLRTRRLHRHLPRDRAAGHGRPHPRADPLHRVPVRDARAHGCGRGRPGLVDGRP